MKFARRSFIAAAVALSAAFALPVAAQTAGKDYTLLNPAQPTDEPLKIEVTEFFSYGCGHCNDFHPILAAWVAKQPADVVVKRVPVSFNSYFAMIAPLYYALEATGDLARLDGNVFRTIHGEGNRLADTQSRAAWAARNGLDAQKLDDTFRSFSVSSKVRRADQQTQAYKIQGVPALAIDGKYLISGAEFNQQLAVAEQLIAKIRREKFGRK
ncbi:MAG: thiol:disulfide interchange protein DsbA/DsbL [Azonexus sp.]